MEQPPDSERRRRILLILLDEASVMLGYPVSDLEAHMVGDDHIEVLTKDGILVMEASLMEQEANGN